MSYKNISKYYHNSTELFPCYVEFLILYKYFPGDIFTKILKLKFILKVISKYFSLSSKQNSLLPSFLSLGCPLFVWTNNGPKNSQLYDWNLKNAGCAVDKQINT